jgi:hypothetical protein
MDLPVNEGLRSMKEELRRVRNLIEGNEVSRVVEARKLGEGRRYVVERKGREC